IGYSVLFFPVGSNSRLDPSAAAAQPPATGPLPPGSPFSITSDVLVLPRFPWPQTPDEIDRFGRDLLSTWMLAPAPNQEALELLPPPVGEVSRAFAQRASGDRPTLSTVIVRFLRNGMDA